MVDGEAARQKSQARLKDLLSIWFKPSVCQDFCLACHFDVEKTTYALDSNL